MCGGFLQRVFPDPIVYDPNHVPPFIFTHVYANAGHWEFTHNRGQALSEAEVALIPRDTTPKVVPQDSESVWVEDTQAVNNYRYYILALLVASLAAALTVNATMQ